MQPARLVASACFGMLLSAAVVVGAHIHLEAPFDSYHSTQLNYIDPFSPSDAVVFVVLASVISVLAFLLFRRMLSSSSCIEQRLVFTPINTKQWLVFATVLFIAWLPYLFAYWPGLVFGDTLTSFRQIGGSAAWNNQHPVPYTLFIGACLLVGKVTGNVTWGVAFYCLVQMLFMALCIAFVICWCKTRTGVHVIWAYLALAVFGLLPSFATYSIAIWKDPIFSCAVAVSSVLLADIVYTRGNAAADNPKVYALLALMAAIVVFFRNNGLYIVGATGLAVLCWSLWNGSAGQRCLRKVAGIMFGVALAGLLTATVLYPALGIHTPKKESVGMLLNQMARVVVYHGVMDEEDTDYLASLMPLEEYVNYYTPCIADPLKNSEKLNQSALDDRFLAHWARLGIKNPGLYFDAWVLETFGFWTVNRPEIYSYTSNIMAGVPRNIDDDRIEQLTRRGIEPANLLGDSMWRTVFPLRSLQVPIGPLVWLVVFISFGFAVSRHHRWLIPLVPSLMLVFTLLVATPLYYWPRYALAIQLLMPFYFTLLYASFIRSSARRQAHQ